MTVYEADLTSLIQRHRCDVDPLLRRLQPHLSESDLRELRDIVRDIQARIARFEQLTPRRPGSIPSEAKPESAAS